MGPYSGHLYYPEQDSFKSALLIKYSKQTQTNFFDAKSISEILLKYLSAHKKAALRNKLTTTPECRLLMSYEEFFEA